MSQKTSDDEEQETRQKASSGKDRSMRQNGTGQVPPETAGEQEPEDEYIEVPVEEDENPLD